jgi:choline kinase
MKAIILSAGQGRRLLPLTENLPKCLLPVVGENSALELQLWNLAECGVDHVNVMVGFGAGDVETALGQMSIPGLRVETQYNPFYRMSDNLITCWLARAMMMEDFVLLNGDTLFETAVLQTLLDSPEAPVTLAINRKLKYDDDDMKVALEGQSLRAVGKTLDLDVTDGESIGMMVFRNDGPSTFSHALDTAVRDPNALKAWYLSVFNDMAASGRVQTADIGDLWWGEVDCQEDLLVVRSALERSDDPPAISIPRR